MNEEALLAAAIEHLNFWRGLVAPPGWQIEATLGTMAPDQADSGLVVDERARTARVEINPALDLTRLDWALAGQLITLRLDVLLGDITETIANRLDEEGIALTRALTGSEPPEEE